MLVTEIYASKQGEGLLTGTPSVFVRLSGCNLRCDFCDTPYSSWNPEGNTLSIAEIVDRVRQFSAEHLVITGGEPMIFKQLPDLCRQFAELGIHITIETAGTAWLELDCDLMSISPKLSNSTPSEERAGEWARRHEQRRYQPGIVDKLIAAHSFQLKFVVDTPDDLTEIESYLNSRTSVPLERVLMMPQGTTLNELDQRAAWLQPYCESRGFRFCDRMHIRWYGNRRGT